MMKKKTNTKQETEVETEVEEVQNTDSEAATAEVVEETPSAPEVVPTKMTQEDEALEQRFLRLQADFDNYRKRTVRDRAEWATRATEDLLKELLPVIDHYELGMRTAEQHQTDKAVIEGFRMVYDQFQSALAKFNLKAIDAEEQPFDPHLHEAVTHLPSEDHPADTVIAQTRRGYMLGDKLLRAAQVVVSSGPSEGTPAAATAGTDTEGGTD